MRSWSRGRSRCPDVAPLCVGDGRDAVRGARRRRRTPVGPLHPSCGHTVVGARPPRRVGRGRAAPAAGAARPSALSTQSARPVGSLLTSPVELCIFRAPVDNDGYKILRELSRRIGDRRHGARDVARCRARPSAGRRPRRASSPHRARRRRLGDPLPTRSSCRPSCTTCPRRGDVPAARAVSVSALVRPGAARELSRSQPRARCSACGRGRSTTRRIWCPRSSGSAPIAAGSNVSTRRPAERCASRHCLRAHCTARRHTSPQRTCTPPPTRPTCGRDANVVVHADVIHRGLGTASCGPDILDRYRVAPGTYRFSYRLVAGDRATAGRAGGTSRRGATAGTRRRGSR